MNKLIMLALLIGLSSYSCHAVVLTSDVKPSDGIEEDLNAALADKSPDDFVVALKELERAAIAHDDKLWIMQNLHRSLIEIVVMDTQDPFYFLFDKSFKQICLHVYAQMELIRAQRKESASLWDAAVITILKFGFLTSVEKRTTVAFIAGKYWPSLEMIISPDVFKDYRECILEGVGLNMST